LSQILYDKTIDCGKKCGFFTLNCAIQDCGNLLMGNLSGAK
jgi:hypothetical protein